MKNEKNNVKVSNLIDNFNLKWSVKILVLSFILSVGFSILSDSILTHASFFISLTIIAFLLLVGVVADMCGVAITSCNIEKFEYGLNSQNKNIKTAINLIKNSDKISVICCDIIGDICSILGGACGASIVYKLISSGIGETNVILVSSCVSGIIACLTIFFKSLEKSIAVTKNKELTLFIAKCINYFKK